MPRKVITGVGYDDLDDYDNNYDDDGYDYDYDEEEDGEIVEVKAEPERHGVWSCSICTYDNDESMTVCDICGVFRIPEPNIGSGNRTVCKDTEASIMAKSLYASLPHQPPKSAMLFQMQSGDFETHEGNNKLGNFQGRLNEFHEIFNTHNNRQINIAPFKFDSPSPDDLVSNGLRASKMGSKANFEFLNPSKASVISEDNGALNGRSVDGRLDDVSVTTDTKNQANKGVKIRGSANSKEESSESLVKGSQGSITIDIDSADERMDSSSASKHKGKHENVDGSSDSSVNKGKSHSITNNMSNLGLHVRYGNPSSDNARKATLQKQYKPEEWMFYNEAEDTLIQLNLAIVGHVDSGKSTLSGRLLHLSGRISQKQMHKYEKDAKTQGKGSFAYAWALDHSAEERERGVTMTVAVAYFDSKRYHVVVLDSPGHKDFVPNMISGATQADAAILVIDASVGSFEAGMDGMKGQTKEHAQLIRSFGVEQLIVAVNKMDVVGYSKDRFDLIKQQVGVFLHSCGFKDSSISWVPLSVMENQNLVSPPSDARFSSWYQGPNLLNAIDSFQPPSRDLSKPVLMPICDVIRSVTLGMVACSGKLETGALRGGSKVLVLPCGEVSTIRSLERDSQPCPIGRAGDNVAVGLLGIDGNNVVTGGVLCHPDFPVHVAKHLEIKILVLDAATPILVGSQLEFHIHHVKEPAKVVKILSLLDPKTGKVTKKAPRCLVAKQSAVLEVLLQGPVCVDKFSNCRALGRVFLRALGRTIAVGIVTEVIE